MNTRTERTEKKASKERDARRIAASAPSTSLSQGAGVYPTVSSPRRDVSDIAPASCTSFKKLMAWQADRMRSAIEEDKWFLSEQAGRDVGPAAAEKDFMDRYLTGCAVDWRRDYCGGICSHRNECALGKAMLATA